MTDRMRVILGHLHHRHPQHAPIKLQAASGALPATAVDTFRYTLDTGNLSYEQRKFYEENGFLVVRGLVSEEDLAKYKQRFDDICAGQVVVPGITKMKDVATKDKPLSERVLNKIQDFQHDDVLFKYCCTPEVVEYVKNFTGLNVQAAHTMLINKPPDSGSLTSRHPMHQDLYYFPFRPADRIVCSWTAMERVNRQNGCLVVCPGTHQGEFLAHGYPKWEGGVNKMYHGIQDYDPATERVHLEMEAGDTVFFHPLLIHGSGTNRTTGYRKAISCHYAASECFFIDVEDTMQSEISEEVMKIAERRLGKELADSMTYQDIWRFRSRTVAGDEWDN